MLMNTTGEHLGKSSLLYSGNSFQGAVVLASKGLTILPFTPSGLRGELFVKQWLLSFCFLPLELKTKVKNHNDKMLLQYAKYQPTRKLRNLMYRNLKKKNHSSYFFHFSCFLVWYKL